MHSVRVQNRRFYTRNVHSESGHSAYKNLHQKTSFVLPSHCPSSLDYCGSMLRSCERYTYFICIIITRNILNFTALWTTPNHPRKTRTRYKRLVDQNVINANNPPDTLAGDLYLFLCLLCLSDFKPPRLVPFPFHNPARPVTVPKICRVIANVGVRCALMIQDITIVLHNGWTHGKHCDMYSNVMARRSIVVKATWL